MDDIKVAKLHENEYILDEDNGDIILTKEIAARENLENNDCVTVSFLDEEKQTHYPLFKVHKNWYNVKLEWLNGSEEKYVKEEY